MLRAIVIASILAPLATAQDRLLRVVGAAPGAQFGRVVDWAGDVDGDGHEDFVVGLATAGPPTWAGRVELRSGRHGAVLRTLAGLAAGDRFGAGVAGAKDANGDGFADVAVGAPFDDRGGADAGSVTMISGRDGSVLWTALGPFPGANFGAVLDCGDEVVVGVPLAGFAGPLSGSAYVLDRATGVVAARYDGAAPYDAFGFSVASLGDLDGDGLAEVGVGAPQPAVGQRGYVRVHRANGTILYRFDGDGVPDFLGWSLTDAGDVDNDGRPDVAAGMYGRSQALGAVRVWSGRTGAVLHTFDGGNPFERLGFAVAPAGDVDADGHDDVAAGTESRGIVRVFSGRTGAELWAIFESGKFGAALAGNADSNRDGVPDMLAGDPWDDTETGSVSVVSVAPRSLTADKHAISLAAGGTVSFTLAAGSAFAGRTYVLIGSLSGTVPGVGLGLAHLPLNLDGYSLATLANPNRFPLTNSAGVLNGGGAATASFGLPAGFGAIGPGLVFDHAYLLVPAPGFDFASNAVVIRIDP